MPGPRGAASVVRAQRDRRFLRSFCCFFATGESRRSCDAACAAGVDDRADGERERDAPAQPGEGRAPRNGSWLRSPAQQRDAAVMALRSPFRRCTGACPQPSDPRLDRRAALTDAATAAPAAPRPRPSIAINVIQGKKTRRRAVSTLDAVYRGARGAAPAWIAHCPSAPRNAFTPLLAWEEATEEDLCPSRFRRRRQWSTVDRTPDGEGGVVRPAVSSPPSSP